MELVRGVIARHPGRDITLISQENGGKGAAVNAGLDKAKGDFFVTMDSDSFIQRDGLKRLLAYFVDDDVGAVLPLMAVHRPQNLLQGMQWTEYIVNMFYKRLMAKLHCLHVVPGPFPVYRTAVLRQVGKFDAGRNLTEDLEMAYRLQRAHFTLVQADDVTVETISPRTLKEFYAQRNRWFKGAVLNTWQYRKLLFNKEFGDFGVFQLPTVLLAGILALILVSQTVYYAAKPVAEFVRQLSFINFDVWTLLWNMSLDVHAFDVDYTAVLLSVSMLAMSLVIIVKSHRWMSRRVFENGWRPVIAYALVYFLVLGVAWAGVFADLVRGKRQRW